MKQVDALLDFKDEVDLMVKRINFLSMASKPFSGDQG
jgi:hypothetical protein